MKVKTMRGLFFGVVAILVQAKSEDTSEWSCMETGKKYSAKATAYYPSNDGVEGGFVDTKDTPLRTLQQFLKGKADYVSVAMDELKKIKYGTKICIPELNNHYKKYIEFRVVDTGSSFKGKGFTRIDICVQDEKHSFEDIVNGRVTLYFPD